MLESLRYPAAAYHSITKDLLAIMPVWGGAALTAKFLAAGGGREEGCPFGTHDVMVLEQNTNALGLYSVQPMDDRPFSVRRAYRRTRFEVFGDRAVSNNLTGIRHSVLARIAPNTTSDLPPVRMAVAADAFGVFAAYRKDNGMDAWPNLLEKMSPAVRRTLPSAVHLKMGIASNTSMRRYADLLPSLPGGPYLIEIVSYWEPNGDFDAHYPDFLAISKSMGGADSFRALIAAGHARGDLMSVYTNPTWWHEDTRGVEELGGATKIGVRQPNGELAKQEFSGHTGFIVGLWRPDVQAFVSRQLSAFRDDYKLDMVFQDQYGTRGGDDYAADLPQRPDAYTEGVAEMAQASAAVLPIASEGVGFDRTFRYLTATMGFYLNTMTHERKTEYDPNAHDGNWQQWPLGTLALHDKVAFYPHNLDSSVDTSENLSWALAFGMNMHGTYDMNSDILRGLSYVQRRVGRLAFGVRASGFRYLNPARSLTRTSYVNGLDVIASHEAEPCTVDTSVGPVTLAPHGFVALRHKTPICALWANSAHRSGTFRDWDVKAHRWQTVMDWNPVSIAE